MKEYQAESIRNVAVLGHGSEGKTTLTEAMLFASGAVDRQGRVEDGATTTDFEPEETKRSISLSAAVAPVEWNDAKINLIDVPGYFEFIGEMMGPLKVAEASIILVGSVSGVTVGTEKAWDNSVKYGVSRAFVINQMDREHASFNKVLAQLQEKYGSAVVPAFLPIGEGIGFKGVADVISGKAYTGAGKNLKVSDIPADMAVSAKSAFGAIEEAAAGADEALMEAYFENGELSREDTLKGLRRGIADGSIVPVFCVAGVNGTGVAGLLDAIAAYLPSPVGRISKGVNPRSDEPAQRTADPKEPFSALVFKTIADPFVGKLSLFKVCSGTLSVDINLLNANSDRAEKAGTIYFLRGKKQITTEKVYAGDICALAKLQYTNTGNTLCDAGKPVKYDSIEFPLPSISMAVYAKKSGEEDKVFSGLSRLMEEDPSIRIEKNPETLETLLSGQGELHLEVVSRKLSSKFGVEANLQDPKIPYRETIRKSVKAQGRHKKQTGGHGQFGDVWIEFQPIGGGSTDFEFVDKVVGGVVPRNFIPSVEKGLRENLPKGVIAGYPMVGLRAILYDGSYHPVDSSEMAFKTAARLAYKKGCKDASPALLEPIYHIEVEIPDEYMGDVIGDLNKRRGRILGMSQSESGQQVVGEVPLSEVLKYATDLRSMTQARGSFTTAYERYEEVPGNIAQKIIDAAKKDEEEEE
ncbi:MAG: elongation factor G [Oscillospiraceae bacterium]|jgi:elongation factor G|nr:elongation factor G [Oscillospiraceae bacterium]